jgi:hypothetical protein
MQRPSFVSRVEALRDSWYERRTLLRLAGSHDFDSQFGLLLTLYDWAAAAVADAAGVYDGDVPLLLSPRPDRRLVEPSFSVTIAGRDGVLFALAERRLTTGSRWHVTAALTTARRDGAVTNAGPERRNGGWTRGRVEDLVLSLIGAYERSRGEADEDPPAPGRTRSRRATRHDAAS